MPIPFDACDPTGTFVFVSYAHSDKALVYPELRAWSRPAFLPLNGDTADQDQPPQ